MPISILEIETPARTHSGDLAALLARAIQLQIAVVPQHTLPVVQPLVPTITATTTEERVLETIAKLGSPSPRELVLHLQVSRATLGRALSNLNASRRVATTGTTKNRRYSLAQNRQQPQ